jgi:DcuC family C4-dicarboxylate transporter
MTPQQVVAKVTPLNLLACGSALAAFWVAAVRWPPRAGEELETPTGSRREPGGPAAEAASPVETPDQTPGDPAARVNVIKALVPLLPLVLLFLLPAIRRHALSHLPQLPGYVEIAAAMLIGSTAAALTAPRCANGLTGAFFEGAGFAYAHIISFIVVATTFAAGVAATGLIERAAALLAGAPAALTLAGVGLPWSMATVTGTGIGTGVPLIKILVPLAEQSHADPLRIGTLIAIFAQFGRTTSPVAPIVILSATLAGASPLRLLWRVVPALLVGGAVLVTAVLLGWI